MGGRVFARRFVWCWSARAANYRGQALGLLALSTSGKPALFACTKSSPCPIQLAGFLAKAQRALKRSLDFSPVNHYRDHFHPTLRGTTNPSSTGNRSSPARFEDPVCRRLNSLFPFIPRSDGNDVDLRAGCEYHPSPRFSIVMHAGEPSGGTLWAQAGIGRLGCREHSVPASVCETCPLCSPARRFISGIGNGHFADPLLSTGRHRWQGPSPWPPCLHCGQAAP